MFRNRRDSCAVPAFARMPCLTRYDEAGTDLPCHTAGLMCSMEPITIVSDNVAAFAALSDDELVERVKHFAACERRASVALIRSLLEFDARRLYLREGCSSLFTYCTHVLHLSEGSAYNRIETARAARVSEGARSSRTRRPHTDCRPPARAAFDACKSRRGAGGRTAQEQAGNSGAHCVIEPSPGGCDHHPAGGAATNER